MAHIQFRIGEATTNDRRAQLIVDGVDITDHVLADGFEIDKTGDREFDPWYVQVRFVAESLDLDLPDSVLVALRESVEKKAAV